uniref:Uncharacterized protein n=1 Tax=Anguilla anguilla TaxID=7936 RepID=A0A0E9QG31_ANGAN
MYNKLTSDSGSYLPIQILVTTE